MRGSERRVKWQRAVEHTIPRLETERYRSEQSLAIKVLLLDNAPGHPKHLDSIHPNITIRYILPNTASLIQLPD